MSELRYNIISRDWVVIATERAKRPQDFRRQGIAAPRAVIPEHKDDCPFCPGNEGDGSDERFRIGDKKSWRVRSIYNKYPAFSDREKLVRNNEDIHHSMSGFGLAEVLVESPRHNAFIALMPAGEVLDIVKAYRSRYMSIEKIEDIEAIIVFKNHGPRAGTSQEHPHSQIIATPIVPPQIRSRMENAAGYFDATGRCIFCHLLAQELKDKARIVLETERFVSFIPYAPAVPFLIWIFPRKHAPSFADIDEKDMRDLADNLKATIAKLYHGLNNPDFNYTIRSVPVKEKGTDYFHWHLNIVPRITDPAGFELGSGIFINTSLPEESAKFLRGVKGA